VYYTFFIFKRNKILRIETICEGGFGGSAHVVVQLRNCFPGLGGRIITKQDLQVAYRLPSNIPHSEDLNCSCERSLNLSCSSCISGIKTFLRHVIIKKLDDFFFRTNKYNYSHVPRPLGSTEKGGYLYEWVFGNEGFVDEVYNKETQILEKVYVDEWNQAADNFASAGIKIFDDICDAENNQWVKNIIIEEPELSILPSHISKMWKRIDFGCESLNINYDKLDLFMFENKKKLLKYLGIPRVKMIELASKYLNTTDSIITEELQHLVKLYRISTANYMGIEGLSPSKFLPKRKNKTITFKRKEIRPNVSYFRKIRETQYSTIDLEIRPNFPCIDGCIYTKQELLVAKYTQKNNFINAGFEAFLRHLIIKKLDDTFISQKKYFFPHITRPFGSEQQSYYYEWAFGSELCSKNLLSGRGLNDWFEFTTYFEEAGIDMQNKITFVNNYAKQIIVKQPRYSEFNKNYISRLWQRISLQEESVNINFKKLIHYFQTNERWLKIHMKEERFETILLAIKYLQKDIKDKELFILKEGIRNYRASTLRHVNYQGFEDTHSFYDKLKIG
jgi:hypothetical protein